MTLVLHYSARSDRGLVRANNQDSVYAGPRLLALADGMGGHAAGELASKLVIAALVPLDDDDPGDDLLAKLRAATAAGNAAITALVAEDPELDGMGTTLTAVLFAGNRLGIVHVGDSRAYLMRDGVFTQITRDDTFVQSLIEEGRITEDEAASHPQRSLLLRALTGHELEPSLTVREARAGDRYLLCSDGLSGVVSAETLAETLHIPEPDACADRLIELALKGGGPDNITCIVADVVDVHYGEDAPILAGAAGNGDADPPPPDSAAARASATTLHRPAPAPAPVQLPSDRPPRLRGLRIALAVVVLLALLGVGAWLARMWVLAQYYVGADGGRVVIFQGVRGSVLGFALHRVAEGSCPPNAPGCVEITMSDLEETGRSAVHDGITADSLGQARQTIQRLRTDQLLPPCPTPPGATAPATASPPVSVASHPPATAGPPDAAPGTAPGAVPGAAADTASSVAPSPPPLVVAPEEPGTTCRPVG